MSFLIKAYINGNLGDDLMLITLCERYPSEKFIVTGSKNYAKTFETCKNLQYKKNDTLFHRLVTFIYRRVHNKSYLTYAEYLLRKKYKAIIIIGGSMYIENGNTLALICSYPYESGSYYGSTRVLIDFGQYLNPPTGYDPIYSKSYVNTQSKYYNESPNFVPAWTTYGENVIWGQRQIPIALMMPIRMKARTKTISAVNTIKHISGKTFDVTFTNSPPGEWSEDTPGYPPGVLN